MQRAVFNTSNAVIRRIVVGYLVVVCFCFALMADVASAANYSLSYSGRLTQQSGAAVEGPVDIQVSFWSSNTVGAQRGETLTYLSTELNQGIFSLILDLRPDQVKTIFGDGSQSRDFTYVGNAVQALMKAASAPNVSGQVFNVGTGNSVTVLRLVEELNKTLGTNITPLHGAGRAGDVRYSKADISRTRALLGYDPTVTFEEGLAKTTKWYRGQPWE